MPRGSHRDRSLRSRPGTTTEAVGTGCASNTIDAQAALEAQVHIEGKMEFGEIAEVIVEKPRNLTYVRLAGYLLIRMITYHGCLGRAVQGCSRPTVLLSMPELPVLREVPKGMLEEMGVGSSLAAW